MKIPNTLVKPRYYLAKSLTQAFSSWSSQQEAQDSFLKLIIIYPQDAQKVKGIILVNSLGRQWVAQY